MVAQSESGVRSSESGVGELRGS